MNFLDEEIQQHLEALTRYLLTFDAEHNALSRMGLTEQAKLDHWHAQNAAEQAFLSTYAWFESKGLVPIWNHILRRYEVQV